MQLNHLDLMRTYWTASALSVLLLVATLVDPQWIERWFDEAPDGGDGSAERWIVGACFAALALAAAWLARREQRRLRPGTAP